MPSSAGRTTLAPQTTGSSACRAGNHGWPPRPSSPAPATKQPRTAARDATSLRWSYDPDGCCDLRKVEPLRRALAPFDAWISGRKGFQGKTRSALPRFEEDEGRLKLNPLADWDRARIEAYFVEHDLPRHPLVEQGYPSIGCVPCTSKVQPGEDPRAGRWRGWDKVECGIHLPGKPGEDPIF